MSDPVNVPKCPVHWASQHVAWSESADACQSVYKHLNSLGLISPALPIRLETAQKYSYLLCVSSCSCTERCKHKNLCSLWRLSYCEEIPVEENEVNDSSSKSSMEAKPEASPQLPKKSVTASTLTSTGSSEAPASVSVFLHCSGIISPFFWDFTGNHSPCEILLELLTFA